MITPWLILFLILLALAWPVALAEKSWLRLLVAMVLSFLVVVLPLFFFFLSSFRVPEWKGACLHGWLDCFIVGKLALTPFVLVATAALYNKDVLRVKTSTARWTTVGIFLGAIVSMVCLVFGLVCIGFDGWMLVPLYVAVWYFLRAVQLIRATGFGFWTYFVAMLGTVPFWILSWLWSARVFETLPNQAPKGCFVVTAAGRGHKSFVGPFFEIERGGHRLQANQQLITLWQFENLWQKKLPRSHRAFRNGYNWLGPRVASRIRSPWLADVTFIALKPAEWLASFCLNRSRTKAL